MSAKLLDQNEMLALKTELLAKAKILGEAFTQATGENVVLPAMSDDCVADASALESFCAGLQSKLNEHAKPVATTPTPAAAAAAVTEKANLTERVRWEQARQEGQRKVSGTPANGESGSGDATHTLTGMIEGRAVTLQLHQIKKPTLTEKVLAARGCKSLAELGDRAAAGEFNDPLD